MKQLTKNISKTIFITLLSLLFVTVADASAQTPGGTNLPIEVWLSADRVNGRTGTLPSDGTPVNSWTSAMPGQGRDYTKNDYASANNDAVPVFNSGSTMNFQPSVIFDTDGKSKLINKDMLLEPSKAYFVFHVSRVDDDKERVLFAFNAYGNTGERNNDIGWYQGQPYFALGGTRKQHQGDDEYYGLNVAIIPNSKGNPGLKSYLDGVSNTTNFVAGVQEMAASRANNRSVLGASSSSSKKAFAGELMELIIVSSNNGSTISADDFHRISTYLAIKYGISLKEGNYVSRNGALLWDRVRNTGYNEGIFGIGRDDASALYQKQSQGSSSSFKVFVGNELKNLNVQNNTNINNENFVMFGSNGLTRPVVYRYDPKDNPPFITGQLDGVINYRDGNVLRTQLTNVNQYTVNIQAAGTYILVSHNDPFFAPQNTSLHKIDPERGYATVTLQDGDYLSTAYYADGPGGVSADLRMWLSANDKNFIQYNTSTGDIISWKDRTRVSNTVYQYINPDPGYSFAPRFAKANRSMNYYPSVEFTLRDKNTKGDYLSTYNAPASIAKPREFTTVHVIHQEFSKDDRNYFMAFGSTVSNSTSRYPAFGLRKGSKGVVGRFWESSGSGENEGSKELSKVGATSININTIDVANRRIRFEANGVYDDKSTSASFGNGFKMNGSGVLGAGSLNYAAMVGNMAEAIYFERVLTPAEIDKIYSSFAIKYGVTLRFENRQVGDNFDYQLSDGSYVWRGNTPGNYMTYYNNIAGIVRDDAAGVFNNISNSTDAQSVVTMMLRGIESLDGQGDATLFDVDKQFLFWGNDGAEGVKEFSTQEMKEHCTPAGQRSNRIWMVRKSNNLDVAKVSLLIQNSAELAGFSNIAHAGVRIHMYVADDPAKLRRNEWDMAIPSTYLKYKGQQLEYNFTDEFTYFTFGIENVVGAGCENCNYKTVQSIDFNKSFQNTYWPNGTTSKSFPIGYDYDSKGNPLPFNATITTGFMGTGKAQFSSSSPRLYQDAAVGDMLYLARNGDSSPTMRTTIETTSPSAAIFQIRGINRLSKLYSDVTISGYCEGDAYATVYPAITAVNGNEKLTTFTIQGNKVISKSTPTTNTRNDRANRNVVNVKFSSPVKKIQIDQNLSGAKSGAQWLAISDISYYCPAPIPPFNEAGLSMRMSAFPKNVILCGRATPVKYEIDVFNSNCNDKYITVRDTLPENMYWDVTGIMIDDIAKEQGKTIIQVLDKDVQGDKRILKIIDLKILGDIDPTRPFTFSARAFFVKHAPEGTYQNQAWFDGEIVKNGTVIKTKPYPSADLVLGDGEKTPVTAINGGMDLEPVVLAGNNPGCYTENQEIPMRFVVTNPNTENIGKLILEASYNEELEYVKNSLTVNGIKVEPLFEKDNTTGQNIPGYLYLTYTKFAQLAFKPNGKLEIEFRVKVTNYDNLVPETDKDGKYLDWEGNKSATRFPKGKQAIADMYLQFAMDSEDDNPCISASFDDAIFELRAPYCRSKEYIISNKHVTGKIIQ